MPVTLSDIRCHLDEEKVTYTVVPERRLIQIRIISRDTEARHMVNIIVDEEGQFVGVRSVGFRTVTADHPFREALLTYLCQHNCSRGFVTLGWDPEQGSVVAEEHLFVGDADGVTHDQLITLLFAVVSAMDSLGLVIDVLLSTGLPPGRGGGAEDEESCHGNGRDCDDQSGGPSEWAEESGHDEIGLLERMWEYRKDED